MIARRSLTVLVLAAALVVVGAVVGAGAGSVQPTVTSSNVDVYRKTSVLKNLNTAAVVKTTIVSVTLPPGSWILTGEATVVTFGDGLVVRCGVFAGSTQLQANARGAYAAVDEMGAVGAVRRSSSFTASFKCWQDGPVSGSPNYVDPGAALWAHKSSNLNL